MTAYGTRRLDGWFAPRLVPLAATATGVQEPAFTPVTDVMLPRSRPADWTEPAADPRRLGLQPPLTRSTATTSATCGWCGRVPYDNLIIDTSVDEYVFALDARAGELAWETQVLDYTTHPANQSTGRSFANGKVVSGRGCMPAARPEACVITAHDVRTGEELWRRRTTPAPGEPGDETWGGVPDRGRRHVGTWMAPSLDPALNLLYIRTSVRSPAPKFMLGGADLTHLYHHSTLALDGDTGEIAWY